MRIVLGILLFPFAWIAVYLYRILVIDLAWGLFCLVSRIFNPIRFIGYLIYWVFILVLDLIYSLYAATLGAIDFTSDIMFEDEPMYGDVFTGQKKFFGKYIKE